MAKLWLVNLVKLWLPWVNYSSHGFLVLYVVKTWLICIRATKRVEKSVALTMHMFFCENVIKDQITLSERSRYWKNVTLRVLSER